MATVGAFALAQPLLDLLGRNPEIFIARGFTALDVALFPIPLILVPVLLALPVLALRAIGPWIAGLAHAVVIGALFAIFSAGILVALTGHRLHWAAFTVICVALGTGFAVAYARFATTRSIVRWASLAPVAFAAWFLVMTPAGDVALAMSGQIPEPGEIENPVPVVLVVFDEFPVATIIDSKGNLLDEQFPNLARVAADGVWYRNAVGVRQYTEEAIPTIVTGVGAAVDSIPTASDHPLSLLSLLSDTYDVAAVENVTDLCPDFACVNSSRRIAPLTERWGGLARDLSVVYGHLTMPGAAVAMLPPIDQTWGNFTTSADTGFDIIERFWKETDDRQHEVDRFVATFERPGAEPQLRFGHFLYPHHPWELVADGRRSGVTDTPGAEGNGWGTDTWLVAQGYQRHILQSQYADTMLGRIVDRMEEIGIYDDALLVVVADHGIAITPGVGHQRLITPETVGSIAAIPLFVKYPAGTPGVVPGTIDDTRSETVDILPTIAEVVGADVPWELDGLSLLDQGRSERARSVMLGRDGPVAFGVGGGEKLETAAEKEAWFPGGDPWKLAPPGWGSLIGRPVGDLDPTDDPEVAVSLLQQSLLDALPEDSPVVPSFLSGRVRTTGSGATGNEIVAISVDGEIAAVTRAYHPQANSASYQAMIPPRDLHPGRNQVIAWLVSGGPADPRLSR